MIDTQPLLKDRVEKAILSMLYNGGEVDLESLKEAMLKRFRRLTEKELIEKIDKLIKEKHIGFDSGEDGAFYSNLPEDFHDRLERALKEYQRVLESTNSTVKCARCGENFTVDKNYFPVFASGKGFMGTICKSCIRFAFTIAFMVFSPASTCALKRRSPMMMMYLS